MRQDGKCIVGNPIQIESYTSAWHSVRVHPTTFYRRQEELIVGLDQSKGLYTELDMGEYVVIRFSDKDDLTSFHRRHNEYI